MTDPTPTSRLNAALDGRYRIERNIGEGGMASVYLAEDLKHERQVALKILRPELAAVIGAERFVVEIKTTANLQHPHILPLFDSGEADGFLYYVMPYIAGENLRDRIEREGQLGVEEAVRIARDVGEALDYAHRNDVIHRDIKPANILLHDGNPLVADFGIALAVSAAGGGRMTETGLSLGTPHYMSPEQASADRDLTARSDVYSLGCVLYEMLAGHPPHTGPSAQSVLVRILTEDPRPVMEARRSVPPNVAVAVTRAIEKVPADRFGSARDFVDALADPGFTYAAVARTGTMPAAAASSAPSTRSRSPFVVALPWVLAAGFAGLATWSMLDAPEPMPVTRSAMDLRSQELSGLGLDLVVAPNGEAFAFVQETDDGLRIAVRRANERDFRTLTGAGSVIGPVFSPDGDWIAYGTQQGLMKVPTSGGAPQPVVPSDALMLPLDWAEDGSILYLDASQSPNDMRIVPNTGGDSEVVYDGLALVGQILPGGNLLLGQTDSVRFVDVARDTSWVLLPGAIHPRFANGHLLWVDDPGAMWASAFDPATGVLADRRGIVLEGVTTMQGNLARCDVSENGTLVYSTGGSQATVPWNNRRLVTVGLDGSVVEETLDPRNIQSPAWSPDGRFVAYSGFEAGVESGDQQIYIYDMEVKSSPRALTTEGVNFRPVWSPEGTRIVFAPRREGSQDTDIYVKEVERDAPASRLLGLEGSQAPVDWISDDRMLIENSDEPWILDLPGQGAADTAVARPFFESEDENGPAQLAPQGDFVTYASNATGEWEVYVRSFPVSGPPISISQGEGRRPQWSGDGSSIYYVRSGDAATLWAASIDRGPPFAVVSRDSVMAWPARTTAPGDLHPDSDRFITTRSGEAADASDGDGEGADDVRYFVVTNWFEEMRARLGGGG